jgi:uncharacterized membrane protein YeaQ/YmgE (transglycosylase-associated protein family)
MSFEAFLVLLLVAGICGALGRTIAGYNHIGCFGSIALGFIGALIGMWIARALKLPMVFTVRVGREDFPVLWSILGSAIFVAILSMLTRKPRT